MNLRLFGRFPIFGTPVISRPFCSARVSFRDRSCGLVGMPNVGKSTLFNALLSMQKAEAANYPFCTIEPNIGRVQIPDPRLGVLSEMANARRIIGTQIEYRDIAGLLRGASRGEGLGNKFLSHIRDCSVIVHVLRCFDDRNITHVEHSVDPVRDWTTIETELVLADLETIERRKGHIDGAGASKKSARTDELLPAKQALLAEVFRILDTEGRPVGNRVQVPEELEDWYDQLQLLTAKPYVVVCNVDIPTIQASGNAHTARVHEELKRRFQSDSGAGPNPVPAPHAGATAAPVPVAHQMTVGEPIMLCASLEEEVAVLAAEEKDPASAKRELLRSYNLPPSIAGLDAIVQQCYTLLGLQVVYTVGEKETRSWCSPVGATAPQIAGLIHSDLERTFVRAETMSYDDFVAYGGEEGCKKAGKWRLEGRDYVCKDGDIFHFRCGG